MRIGIGGGGGTIDAAVDSVRQAKDAGYNAAWFSNIFGLDGMTACAIAGREVPDITLGTFVVPTYSRHPLYMAQQAMTTQAATGGRFILGIGLSHQIVIEGMLGLSFEKPARHMREYLEVLMPILEEGAVEHSGEVYRVNNTFGPRERMGTTPPKVVAGARPGDAQARGPADGRHRHLDDRYQTIADHIAPMIGQAADETGRPAPMVIAGSRCRSPTIPRPPVWRPRTCSPSTARCPPSHQLDREGAAGPGDIAVVGDEDTVRGHRPVRGGGRHRSQRRALR